MADTDDDTTKTSPAGEIRDLWRQFTRPIVDNLDSRLRAEVDKHVDERVEEILKDRLAVFESALADLSRTVKDLKKKIDKGS